MSAIRNVFDVLATKAEEAIPVQDCDYTDEATGLLMCGKCHTPKQCRPFPNSDEAVYCLCACMKADDDAMRERLRQNEIEQHLWNNQDKAAVYDEMNHTGLLVIDDFGCERRTDYMDEIKFNLIDGRLRNGKPCVITTNLMLNDFAAPADLTQKRIVSRLFERATTFHVQGEDRRFTALKERAFQSSSSSKTTTEEE